MLIFLGKMYKCNNAENIFEDNIFSHAPPDHHLRHLMDHRSSCRSAEIAPNQSELRWAIAELVAMMLMLMMMAKVTWTFRYMGMLQWVKIRKL